MNNRFERVRALFLLFALAIMALLAGCGETPRSEVELRVDGTTRTVSTQATTVLQFLKEQGVTLGDLDRVAPETWTQLKAGMVVKVTRVQERYEVTSTTLPYSRRTMRDEALPVGESKLVQLGSNGTEEQTFRIVLEDGIEVSRTLAKRTVTRPPVDEIAVVGAKGTLPAVPITGTIVYASSGNAWLLRETTAGLRPLTSQGDLDLRVFALSPDGMQLLFTRTLTDSEDAPLNSLWLVSTAIKGEEPVSLPIHGVLKAEWSPDGERIAFSTAERTTGAPGWKANNDLWIAVSPEYSPTLVISPTANAMYSWWGETFRWAPDGKTLAYANATEVGIIDLKARTRRRLVEFPSFNSRSSWIWTPAPSWSADGRFIFAAIHGPSPTSAAEDSPVFDLWAIGAADGSALPLATEVGMWSSPACSPTAVASGELVAYGVADDPTRSQFSGYSLWVMDRDGSNRRQLLPEHEGASLDTLDFAWSPEGDSLVVVRQGNLVLVDAQSGKIVPITADGTSSRPQWSR